MKPSLRLASCLLLLLVLPPAVAQKNALLHMEPAFWWTGMKNPALQVLLHGTGIGQAAATVGAYPGVTLAGVEKVENPNYLFLNLRIAPNAQPGLVPIVLRIGKKTVSLAYELRRKGAAGRIQGFGPGDAVYLVMPDRFANGDPRNDTLPGLFQGTHREQPFGRHGGDLKGIADHLDYIKDLGMTALWLNPVLENNQRIESYHGYAITDLYRVDRRFGSNEQYVALVDKCHQMGLKVIQDMVANHIGIEHWLMKDLPEKSWIHDAQAKEPMLTSYRTGTPSDPYASAADLKKMTDGWFVAWMPDVNQRNEKFATYLIQNSLWWIEYAGLDGIRMDTYPYPDKEFMARYARTLLDEYPTFNLVGESWINSVPMTAYWQKGFAGKDGYATQLPSVTDFPFYTATLQALNEDAGWDTGLARLYMLLGQDFIYPDANANLTFLDNHDLTRFYRSVNRDLAKFKLGLAFLLTTRGTPQLYYGTELLMDGDGAVHPDVRRDMPGGWPGDATNAFVRTGRTPAQNEAYDYIKTLLDWRKTKPFVYNGKLMHYLPEDNVYVYFRYDDTGTAMIILNGRNEAKTLDTKRFAERMAGFTQAKDILSGRTLPDLSTITVPARTALVLELGR